MAFLQQSTVIEKARSWVKIYVPSELVAISVDLHNLKLAVEFKFDANFWLSINIHVHKSHCYITTNCLLKFGSPPKMEIPKLLYYVDVGICMVSQTILSSWTWPSLSSWKKSSVYQYLGNIKQRTELIDHKKSWWAILLLQSLTLMTRTQLNTVWLQLKCLPQYNTHGNFPHDAS